MCISFLQKVYYKVFSESDNRVYESTVRSCSLGQCVPRDDFRNCTQDKLVFPGCVRKDCCQNTNLCNAAPCADYAHLTILLMTSFTTSYAVAERLS